MVPLFCWGSACTTAPPLLPALEPPARLHHTPALPACLPVPHHCRCLLDTARTCRPFLVPPCCLRSSPLLCCHPAYALLPTTAVPPHPGTDVTCHRAFLVPPGSTFLFVLVAFCSVPLLPHYRFTAVPHITIPRLPPPDYYTTFVSLPPLRSVTCVFYHYRLTRAHYPTFYCCAIPLPRFFSPHC